MFAALALAIQVSAASASERKIMGFGEFKFGMSQTEIASILGSEPSGQPTGNDAELKSLSYADRIKIGQYQYSLSIGFYQDKSNIFSFLGNPLKLPSPQAGLCDAGFSQAEAGLIAQYGPPDREELFSSPANEEFNRQLGVPTQLTASARWWDRDGGSVHLVTRWNQPNCLQVMVFHSAAFAPRFLPTVIPFAGK